jgi:lipopolysaccharide/colanic/teichoic acid biosynthesis glycosyltransferase
MGLTTRKTNALHFYLSLLIGMLLVASIPPVFPLGLHYWDMTVWKDTTSNSMTGNVVALFIASIVLRRFESSPQKNALAFILPIVPIIFALLLTVLLALRLGYSIQILGAGFLMTFLLLSFQHLVASRHRHLKLFLVPLGEALSFEDTRHYTFIKLKKPDANKGIDGVVADMHSNVLTPAWERFLSNCALQGTPVYNAMQLKEALSGKVNVKHLIANNFGDLSPSSFHQGLKRLVDSAFLILISPIILPVMVIIAIWISLDSPGGVFFVQPRMGLGGKWFNVIKFRSMYVNQEGSHFTKDGEDHRITKVGRIIRKYRLDELPQFWNVLKGEMSLIGPRPESKALAEWYDNEVPFFAYRHVVRPGISGWAQVMHGYAAGVDDMKVKLAYDFYYIKHFSLWLDLLIWYKTIRTVLTGFGSR